MAAEPSDPGMRVLLLAPTSRDGEATRGVLASAGIDCLVCHSIDNLCAEAVSGVAAVIVPEDVVQSNESDQLTEFLRQQPVWSDLPVIVLTGSGVESSAIERAMLSLGNVSLIERPMRVSTLVSVVRSALRARVRQYQVRGHLDARKAAEAALSDSEAKFRQLAETIPQLAWMARADGWIFWYNRRWFEYTGTALEQVKGWGWQSVLDPGELPRVMEGWRRSIKEGLAFEMEFPLKGADGRFRWFLTRVAPLRDEIGNVAIWFGTNTDIEDRRKVAEERAHLLEAERTARMEAERASRMKDEFLATLSHELRTPLNAILGWSHILAGDRSNPEDLDEGLRTIERNARAQAQIIEDLLDMSRIISGKVRLDVQRIDLATVVQDSLETLKPTAEAKDIAIQAVLDPAAGEVSGDASRLQQVFWNLLTNAIKFTPRGGKVQVLLERTNSNVEVSVIDSGEGIKPEFLPFVFDRFRQADASTTRRHGGLGLGLAIVKQLVELHGGNIRVASPGAGRGSTFTVSLPTAIVRAESQSPAARRHLLPAANAYSHDRGPGLQGVRVLVVDDEPDARSLVQRLLEEHKADVMTAGSAAEAIDLLRACPPDVLVSDIGMPVEDGYVLIKRVRALDSDHGGDVPAIALTAYARSEDRMRSVRAGFQLHVAKPVEPAELITMVASLARRTAEKKESVERSE